MASHLFKYFRLVPTIHLFNPDHDYALAVNGNWYTPPSSISRLSIERAFTPVEWASPGDVILIPDYLVANQKLSISPDKIQSEMIAAKNLSLLHFNEVADFLSKHSDFIISPWGWNKSIVYRLKKVGVSESLLPTAEQLENIRLLSHRRTTISFNQLIKEEVPMEFTNVENAMDFYFKNPDCFFKAPWSSSGRGIIACHDLTERHVRPWLRGTIKRQGSVLGEKNFHKTIDFATEWKCSNGQPIYLGVSCFTTSNRGKYHGNFHNSQEELLRKIKTVAPDFGKETITHQKKAIQQLISPYYSGPLGIDMMADPNGKIRSCVEINLRMTMGHVAIVRSQNINMV